MDFLKAQVSQLSRQLQARELEIDRYRTDSCETLQVRRENERLRHQLAQIRRLTYSDPEATFPDASPYCGGITYDSSVLESWLSSTALQVVSPSSPKTGPTCGTSFVLSEPFGLPWNMPPTCPADRIMQPFVEEKRRLIQDLQLDSSSPISIPDSSVSSRAIQSSFSKVTNDLLETYGQIETLPKKVACLFTISSVLNVCILFSLSSRRWSLTIMPSGLYSRLGSPLNKCPYG